MKYIFHYSKIEGDKKKLIFSHVYQCEQRQNNPLNIIKGDKSKRPIDAVHTEREKNDEEAKEEDSLWRCSISTGQQCSMRNIPYA